MIANPDKMSHCGASHLGLQYVDCPSLEVSWKFPYKLKLWEAQTSLHCGKCIKIFNKFQELSVSNSFDPDQARHLAGPDLDPNCLLIG